MLNQERIAVCRDFVEFIHKYTLLLEQQMAGIRTNLSDTVSQVMESVNKINSLTDKKKKQVKESVRDGIVKPPTTLASPEPASEDLLQASRLFSKQIEAISTLDNEASNILVQAVGALSDDDGMGQRLAHVVIAVGAMSRSISAFLNGYPQCATRAEFTRLRNTVLTEVYRSYTTEVERAAFHQVFGAPTPSKKVS